MDKQISLIKIVRCSEGVTIPKNPRTERSVGYAFVDLSTPTEAERAIAELSGKEILERKVSVQLARKPEANVEKNDANGEADGNRRRQSTRGRGRGARARGGRAGRAHDVRLGFSEAFLSLGWKQYKSSQGHRTRRRALRALLLLIVQPPRFSLCLTSLTRRTALTQTQRTRLVLLASAGSVDLPPMAFPPRPRSWWLTCPTI